MNSAQSVVRCRWEIDYESSSTEESPTDDLQVESWSIPAIGGMELAGVGAVDSSDDSARGTGDVREQGRCVVAEEGGDMQAQMDI
mmetsp:Transcript_19059/g.47827  ORF Transcript_19059/g.47827 Transcript_19059/m.47827 type:complete len:85 (+) Transcript_19059:197-451(+)